VYDRRREFAFHIPVKRILVRLENETWILNNLIISVFAEFTFKTVLEIHNVYNSVDKLPFLFVA